MKIVNKMNSAWIQTQIFFCRIYFILFIFMNVFPINFVKEIFENLKSFIY